MNDRRDAPATRDASETPDASETRDASATRVRRRPAAEGDGPSFLTMIGFVAVVVAAVILVFFAIGYVIGRVFL